LCFSLIACLLKAKFPPGLIVPQFRAFALASVRIFGGVFVVIAEHCFHRQIGAEVMRLRPHNQGTTIRRFSEHAD
jgi:hypothetical protein